MEPMSRQHELVVINKVLATLVVVFALTSGYLVAQREAWVKEEAQEEVKLEAQRQLPLPDFKGVMVEAPKASALSGLLSQARYQREIEAETSLSESELVALMWAGQGQITDWGERTAFSYKSQFPLELVVAINRVDGVNPGWYRFESESQQLIPLEVQPAVPLTSAAVEIVAAKIADTKASGELVWFEAGEVAQNVLLMTQELGLGAIFSLDQQNSNLWKIAIGRNNK